MNREIILNLGLMREAENMVVTSHELITEYEQEFNFNPRLISVPILNLRTGAARHIATLTESNLGTKGVLDLVSISMSCWPLLLLSTAIDKLKVIEAKLLIGRMNSIIGFNMNARRIIAMVALMSSTIDYMLETDWLTEFIVPTVSELRLLMAAMSNETPIDAMVTRNRIVLCPALNLVILRDVASAYYQELVRNPGSGRTLSNVSIWEINEESEADTGLKFDSIINALPELDLPLGNLSGMA